MGRTTKANEDQVVNVPEEQTAAVSEETADEKTVTMSKSDFNEIMNRIKMMEQRFVSEDRQKSQSDRKREEEEAMIAQTIAANERAMEMVDYYVDLGSLKSNKNIEVAINGVQYIVPRGKQVRIPRCVKEVIENSLTQRAVSFGLQDEKKADFEEAEKTGALTL